MTLAFRKSLAFASLLLVVLAFSVSNGNAQFVHPGMIQNSADIEFLKEKIKTGAEPWARLWKDLMQSPEADTSWQAHPSKVIVVGFYSKPDIGASDFTKDGTAAYTLALRYTITGEKACADKSISILRAWSNTLDSITDGNKKLLMGMNGIKYLNAAELLRGYKDWKAEDRASFQKMVLNVWYPLIEDFMPGYNGNWDAAIIQTMLCIGICFDRHDIFDRAVNQCLKGVSNGAINNYFNDWGQCQESGRDQGHVQMGLGFLTIACEIAWKQGVDMYGAYSNRLALGYEYTAKYNLGEDVKYVQYIDFRQKPVFADTISGIGRGKFAPVYERAYHHYHDRMGLDMPYTRRALDKSRDEGRTGSYMPWASLLTRDYPAKKF